MPFDGTPPIHDWPDEPRRNDGEIRLSQVFAVLSVCIALGLLACLFAGPSTYQGVLSQCVQGYAW